MESGAYVCCLLLVRGVRILASFPTPPNVNPNRMHVTSVDAAQGFQYMAAILVSVVLILVVVAASVTAPINGKLGLAAGILLAVFSVLELIAFSLMAAVLKDGESRCLSFAWHVSISSGVWS